MNIEYIQTKRRFSKKIDKKILFLLFAIGFFDFVQFSISLGITKFINISGSLEQRLRGTFTINYELFYYYILRLPIFKYFYLLAILFLFFYLYL